MRHCLLLMHRRRIPISAGVLGAASSVDTRRCLVPQLVPDMDESTRAELGDYRNFLPGERDKLPRADLPSPTELHFTVHLHFAARNGALGVATRVAQASDLQQRLKRDELFIF